MMLKMNVFPQKQKSTAKETARCARTKDDHYKNE